MSDPSSASKQMLITLSEIEPIAFYSLLVVGSRSNIPSSSFQDIPENPFHSIYLNSSSVPIGCGHYHEMLSDALIEADLPKNNSSESNILAASEELVIEILAMMREELKVEQNEPFQANDDESIQWKVERRDINVSKKGKEKVVEEVPRRRPTTRYDSKKFMADTSKASARSTAEIRSPRTFKVSNFKMPEFGVIEVSAEETEKGNKKKK
ncbi:hypothetical protein EJD97_006920 [Solanum chilense]|uniref:Uncharacterized protein n=1 Tax=Solanum chilense TaxID=4083 RepID=A0A6N2CCN3_SOLCI|nr:hypothetical protein EJD97_006920 [Solanum chilense]